MNRRDAIITGIGATLALTTLAGAQPKKDPKPPAKPDAGAAVIASLQVCLAKAQACAAHCDTQLAAGDKTFARCAVSVKDMLDIGWATQSMVARKSKSAKKAVDACMTACKECSAACAEHKAHFSHGMHTECKECMEACDACIKACQAFLAA
jgi:Cys-rich four helix bundle protein (predicted Tat secretion target)